MVRWESSRGMEFTDFVGCFECFPTHPNHFRIFKHFAEWYMARQESRRQHTLRSSPIFPSTRKRRKALKFLTIAIGCSRVRCSCKGDACREGRVAIDKHRDGEWKMFCCLRMWVVVCVEDC
jgi:hypothetical protein